MERTIAIGDVHGCAAALATLLDALLLEATDTLITLGDYVDRGPDTRRVIELLLGVGQVCQFIPLLGNHEIMLLAADSSSAVFDAWQSYGGKQTLASYPGATTPRDLPAEHLNFLNDLKPYYETEKFFFTHAGYDENIPLAETPEELLYWRSLREYIPGPHISGKTAVVGHTPQSGGQVLDQGHLICLDTGCCYWGCLTAMDVERRQIWQASPSGDLITKPN